MVLWSWDTLEIPRDGTPVGPAVRADDCVAFPPSDLLSAEASHAAPRPELAHARPPEVARPVRASAPGDEVSRAAIRERATDRDGSQLPRVAATDGQDRRKPEADDDGVDELRHETAGLDVCVHLSASVP
jgi:hypothetical protein